MFFRQIRANLTVGKDRGFSRRPVAFARTVRARAVGHGGRWRLRIGEPPRTHRKILGSTRIAGFIFAGRLAKTSAAKRLLRRADSGRFRGKTGGEARLVPWKAGFAAWMPGSWGRRQKRSRRADYRLAIRPSPEGGGSSDNGDPDAVVQGLLRKPVGSTLNTKPAGSMVQVPLGLPVRVTVPAMVRVLAAVLNVAGTLP